MKCINVCTCSMSVCMGEVTLEDNPGKGKAQNKAQTNSSISSP